MSVRIQFLALRDISRYWRVVTCGQSCVPIAFASSFAPCLVSHVPSTHRGNFGTEPSETSNRTAKRTDRSSGIWRRKPRGGEHLQATQLGEGHHVPGQQGRLGEHLEVVAAAAWAYIALALLESGKLMKGVRMSVCTEDEMEDTPWPATYIRLSKLPKYWVLAFLKNRLMMEVLDAGRHHE